MIQTFNTLLVGTVRKGLESHLPSEEVFYGKVDPGKSRYIGISLKNLHFEEEGLGGSTSVKMELVQEEIRVDGKTKVFPLSRPLADEPVTVADREGATLFRERENFSIDRDRNTLGFFTPPDHPEHSLMVSYSTRREVGMVMNLRFFLVYQVTIAAKSEDERDGLIFETIKTVHLARETLAERGVRDLSLVHGYQQAGTDKTRPDSWILEYRAEVIIPVELPAPPIEKVEIGRK
jgi:hypothetical protein